MSEQPQTNGPAIIQLVAEILEVAQARETENDMGWVDMPTEAEWGIIVGMAKRLVPVPMKDDQGR